MNRNRTRRKRAAALTFLLLAGLVIGGSLWLQTQRRQYTLNRQMIAAVMKDDNKQAIALVNAGADPNTRYRPTPIPSPFQLIKQLLHQSPPDIDNPPALMLACGASWDDKRGVYTMHQQDRPDASQLVRALLEHGAQVHVQGKNGGTPLMWAAVTNRPDSVRLLLEHGADVSVQHKTGLTALHFAVLWGADKAIIQQLLAYGADPNLVTQYRQTPLSMAQNMASPDIVALLKQAGIRNKGKQQNGQSVGNAGHWQM